MPLAMSSETKRERQVQTYLIHPGLIVFQATLYASTAANGK